MYIFNKFVLICMRPIMNVYTLLCRCSGCLAGVVDIQQLPTLWIILNVQLTPQLVSCPQSC